MALVIKTSGLDEFLDPSGGSWIKALVMGNPGAGKTPSAAAWPQPIFADCERGLASVAAKGVPYGEITSIADMEAFLDHLRRDSLQPADRRKYRTVIIDTIDSYQKIVIAERLKSERRDALTMQDWGYIGTKMQQLIEKLLNLPMNVVVNMHVQDDRDKDGEDEILVKKSALKGAIGNEIYSYFDLIGFLETSYVAVNGERTLKRQIRWQSEPKFPMLRARFPGFPKLTDIDFTDRDYFRIFEAVTAGVETIPETKSIESIATEGDNEVEPAPADVQGGPVENPTPPPAKKAAAKKTAAKKTAAAKATPAPEPEVATDVAPPASEKPVTDESETAKAEALLKEQLGAEPIEEEAEVPDPPKAPEAPAPAKSAVYCGTPVVANGTPAKDGCGAEITAENGSKVQIARLKFKTNLCTTCYAAATA